VRKACFTKRQSRFVTPTPTASSIPNALAFASLPELRMVSLKHALLHRDLHVPSLGTKRQVSDFRDTSNQVHVLRERQLTGFNVREITEIQQKGVIGMWPADCNLGSGASAQTGEEKT
jgi:hypothetical protein